MRRTRKRSRDRIHYTRSHHTAPGCPQKPDIPSFAKNIHPGDDFFAHINSNWYKHAHIKPYMSAVSSTSETQDVINAQLMEIIREARGGTRKSKEMEAIGRFADSALTLKYQKNTLRTVRSLLQQIQCIRDTSDLSYIIGSLILRGIPTPLYVYAGPEDKNTNVWRLHFIPGFVGLPSEEYYKGKGPGGMNTLRSYKKLLKIVGEAFDIEEMNKVLEIEKRLSKYINSSLVYDPPVISQATLKRKYPAINWDSLLSGLQIDDRKKSKYVVDAPQFLAILNNMVAKLDLSAWKLLLSANILIYHLPIMEPPFDTYYFNFFRHQLRGDRAKPSNEYVLLDLAKKYLMIPLGIEYIKRHVPREHKKEVRELVDKLIVSAKERISDTEWMDISTRKVAQEKVDGIILGILYPDIPYKYKVPDLTSDDLAENLMRINISMSHWQMEDVKHKLTYKVWTNLIYNVNAHYYPNGNRLVIPAGIANWPYYCSKAPLGWNYGGLGGVIGHEMTHAFDVNGKEFDAKGEYADWWKDADDRMYGKISKDLVKLFNKSKYMGHPVNGKKTLSENIADLGGLAIALGGLEREIKRLRVDDMGRLEALRNFFIAYAATWREKERREKGLQALLTDVHAPAEMRVNLIVPHFQEWYDAFDVKPNHKLYITPDERIRIF